MANVQPRPTSTDILLAYYKCRCSACGAERYALIPIGMGLTFNDHIPISHDDQEYGRCNRCRRIHTLSIIEVPPNPNPPPKPEGFWRLPKT